MTSMPQEFLIEALYDGDNTEASDESTEYDIVIEVGNVYVEGFVAQQPEIIEVFSEPPVGGGYTRIEVLAFTKQGTLALVTNGSEFPIMGGLFVLDSVAGRVVTPPTGSSVILDILKNGVSVFASPGDRPTIASGQNNAVTTIPEGFMFADGDYLEINIVQVGSTVPGETLTAAVRLARIG